jgi:ATP-dependent Lon protease
MENNSFVTNKAQQENIKELIVPLVPLRDIVVFPQTEMPLTFGRMKSNMAVISAYKTNKLLCFVCQKNSKTEIPSADDFYEYATLGSIEHLIETNGTIHSLIKGMTRVKIKEVSQSEPYFIAKVVEDKEKFVENDETKAIMKHLTEQSQKFFNLGKNLDIMVLMKLLSGVSSEEMVNQLAIILDLKPEVRQSLLEMSSINERMEKIAERLSYEMKILELEKVIANKTQAKFDKGMREAILRERKRTIDQELGQLGVDEEDEKDIKELKLKIVKAKMPEEIQKKAVDELKRYRLMNPNNPETGYIRNYLDWLVSVPWNNNGKTDVSLQKAKKVLDEDHYGLKERILEYLAVMKLKAKIKNSKDQGGPTILCFIGPPGVGKTSIGRSIARALDRKFVRISLGGIRDEAEIRGHRRTYVGAMPGRIIQGMKTAGSNNPIFMLDEIDKIGSDFRGDPSSALLEALDPEQNKEFSDHYLEVPYDLSKVFFIATGNMLDSIPIALRDRLEIIRFSGYTEEEKINIAEKYLWKKQMSANGLKSEDLILNSGALKEIVCRYTREAGVRNLERNLATICRKIAKKMAEKKKINKEINTVDIKKYLGPHKFSLTPLEKTNQVGISTGMAWTQFGGEILFVEVALMPGKGQLLLTGQLGDVMKESCQAAMSFIKSHYNSLGVKENFSKNLDVHIHVPEGAVPKDGPSAGVAMTVALVSAITKKPTRRDVSMTGEITLRGRVLEIGGVKEKVLAAHRAGIKTIILPKENHKDLEEVPKEVQKDLKFVFVSELQDALRVAIVGY